MVSAVATRSRKANDTPQPPSAKRPRRAAPVQPANGTPARKSGLAAVLPSAKGERRRPTAVTNGAKAAKADQVDESRTVVAHGDVDMADATRDVVEISSGEEEESAYESSGDEKEEKSAKAEKAQDVAMADGSANGDEQTEEAEPPSFGELLQANAPEVVDVEDAFVDPVAESRALAPVTGNRALSAPSATSLGTVLTQALKTNDKDLMESCFEMNDLDSVRSTIERLPSTLVARLLSRLAERLHKRPGRAGNLMVWVQWALVSHGGYLAGRQDIMRELGSLNRVIRERASGLQPLLTLKGKLDMLSAQLELRRSMQRTTTMDSDDDEGVIYVEGQDDSESENDDAAVKRGQELSKKLSKGEAQDDLDGAESSDDDLPMNLNGEEEDDSEGSEEDDDVVDDEAEETDNDSGDDDDIEEEVDDGEDVSESEMEMPSAKRSVTAQRMGFGAGRRR
ncbi:NUC189-domain-containing protein [Saccharata proteae CBS 121410]|uniref:NUC189-domain-containing protein n=1 Tax=Saccharata proteae CBS 121410 TaxID=1314787 RepID=A0A9P4HZB4_9PEZI|nr:NUC189-domain-containing protein [Saccharata proteae CBS 121410]